MIDSPSKDFARKSVVEHARGADLIRLTPEPVAELTAALTLLSARHACELVDDVNKRLEEFTDLQVVVE